MRLWCVSMEGLSVGVCETPLSPSTWGTPSRGVRCNGFLREVLSVGVCRRTPYTLPPGGPRGASGVMAFWGRV